MPIREEIPLEAPIAGMSMTHELGARPWQTPPQQATVQEAIAHYIERMQDDSITEQIVNILQSDIPVTTLANTIQLAGVMEGRHSIDVGVLILPVIMELIAYVADEAGIEYDMGTSKSIDQDIIPESKMELALSKIKNKSTAVKEEEPMVEPEAVPEENPQPSGLMARRM